MDSRSSSLLPLLLLLFPPLALSRPSPAAEPPDPIGRKPVQLATRNDTWNASAHPLSHLKRYFVRFGYLNETDSSDASDRRFESAVVRYQTNLGLPVTGRLDDATLKQIGTPRCGVPDEEDDDDRGRSNRARDFRRFTFFPGKPRWPAKRSGSVVLTYSLSPVHTIDYINRTEVRAALHRAFHQWAQVIPVRFKETSKYSKADVKIGFYSGDHGDGNSFDGPLNIVAHGFSPESGKLHFDAAERWAVNFEEEESKDALDLESVAVHEIGHVLGLGHSVEKDSVMYPSIGTRTILRQLRLDDVEGAQVLYGSNPDFNLNEFMETETTSSAAAPAVSSRMIFHASVGRWITVVLIVCASLN